MTSAILVFAIAALMPAKLFAKDYWEIYLGAGLTQLADGRYTYHSEALAMAPINLESTDIYETKSTDISFGIAYYWTISEVFYMGLCANMATTISLEQNNANKNIFDSPFGIEVGIPVRLQIVHGLFLTVMPFGGSITLGENQSPLGMTDGNETLSGTTFGVTADIAYYFLELFGIKAIIGYKQVHCLYGKSYILSNFNENYSNQGWFCSAGILLKL